MSPADIEKLSIAERLQLVQDLWDSIAAEPDALPVTGSQLEEVRRRSQAHRMRPDDSHPLDEALERIERSLD